MKKAAQRNVVLITLAAIGGAWLNPYSATACTCFGSPDHGEAFDRSDAVFIASVTEICDYPSWYYDLVELIDRRFDTGLIWQVEEPRVHLKVEASWKGVTARRAETRTSIGSGGCGYPFVEGHRYLIYAGEYHGEWVTGLCGATKAVWNAGDDLEFLNGFLQVPLPQAEPLPRVTQCGSHWKRWWLPFDRIGKPWLSALAQAFDHLPALLLSLLDVYQVWISAGFSKPVTEVTDTLVSGVTPPR